jgi:hypothetical protein
MGSLVVAAEAPVSKSAITMFAPPVVSTKDICIPVEHDAGIIENVGREIIWGIEVR